MAQHMSAPVDRRCLLCRNWSYSKPLPPRPESPQRGICRRDPVAIDKDSRDWCSHWEPRPPAQEPEAA
jgi:hypothetical protein